MVKLILTVVVTCWAIYYFIVDAYSPADPSKTVFYHYILPVLSWAPFSWTIWRLHGRREETGLDHLLVLIGALAAFFLTPLGYHLYP